MEPWPKLASSWVQTGPQAGPSSLVLGSQLRGDVAPGGSDALIGKLFPAIPKREIRGPRVKSSGHTEDEQPPVPGREAPGGGGEGREAGRGGGAGEWRVGGRDGGECSIRARPDPVAREGRARARLVSTSHRPGFVEAGRAEGRRGAKAKSECARDINRERARVDPGHLPDGKCDNLSCVHGPSGSRFRLACGARQGDSA